jgi:hypothetical protein
MFVLLFIGVASFGVAAMRVTPGEAVAPAAVAADIDGEWQAQVEYDWGDTHTEKFVLGYDGTEVLGTASYLGRKRALFDGQLDGDRIRFIVRSQEIAGGDSPSRELVHHYSGKVGENSIHFTLRTEGGVTGHIPIEFTAVRIR